MRVEANAPSRRILLGLVALLTTPGLGAQEPSGLDALHDPSRWLTFGASSGLTDHPIAEITEGPNGHVWAAIEAGVARYDGFQWHRLGAESGVPEMVMDVAVDATGRVTLIADNAGYVGDERGFARVPGDGSAQACETLADGRVGVLYYAEKQCTLRIEGEEREFVADGSPLSAEITIRTDAAGDATWLVTSEALYRLGEAGWEPHGDIPEGVSISTFCIQDGTGRGFAYLKNPWEVRGLWEWDEQGQLERIAVEDVDRLADLHVFPSGDAIVSLISERTYLRRAGEQEWTRLNPAPREMLGVRLLRGRPNGDLWVATERDLSLCRARAPLWTQSDHAADLHANLVLEYFSASDGSLWIGKGQGIEVRRPGLPPTQVREVDGRRLETITAVGEDAAGNMWIASGLGSIQGAYRFDGTSWTHFDESDGLAASSIHKIRMDRRGRPWFLGLGPHPIGGSEEPGAFVLTDEGFVQWGPQQGLPSGRVYDFFEADDGSFWFATLRGIARWSNGDWRVWDQDDGMRQSRVYTMCDDGDGRVWFGHEDTERGLGWIDSEGLVHYTQSEDEAARAQVMCIELDDEQRLWVGTDYGLFVRHRDGWTKLDADSGLTSEWILAAQARGNELHVATTRGGTATLSVVDPDRLLPRVTLADPLVQERTLLARWSVHSHWGSPREHRVRTRSRVGDEPWTAWSTERERTIEGLEYGEHTLEVQVMDDFGSAPPATTQCSFEVVTPFFLRSWVLLVLALASLGATYSLRGSIIRRQRARQTLEESESRFRQLAENVREVFWLMDWKTRQILYVSPTYEQLTGRPVATLYADGSTWVQQIHPEDRDEALERYVALAETGNYEGEYRLVRADGEVRWIRARAFPIRDEQGRVFRIAGVTEDITLPRLVTERMRQSEERYRILVETIPEAIVIHRDTRILFANPAAAELFGIRDVGELLGMSVLDLHHPESREIGAVRIRWVERENRNTRPIDMRMLRADGTTVDVEVTGGPVMFDGEPAIQAIVHDITDRKREEEHRTLLMRELDHRVKNNLAGVLALSQQTITRSRDLPEFERAFTGRIRAMARTHEALAASRWEGVGLAELVRLVVTPYSDSRDERIRIEGRDRIVRSDAAAPLCMALHELATNAAKYGALSCPEGSVTVQWETPEGDPVRLCWRESGGPPISSSRRDGFGLSLVRGMVEHELLGDVQFTFDEGGLQCEMWIPAEQLERSRDEKAPQPVD